MKLATIRSWITPGLIITGVILVIIALIIPNRSFDTMGRKTLATVTELQGSSSVEGLEVTDTAQLQVKAKIKNLDLVRTKSQTTTTVQLADIKSEIKILENSLVLFEENTDGAIVLTIREGQIVIEDLGDKPSNQKVHFWIRKEGRQLSALDYVLTSTTGSQALQKSNINIESNTNLLSQAKIEEILNNKKNDFFRCYGQLIQKEEQAHGQVLLSFEILNTGKVQSVDIAKTDITQNSFLSCLKEVVLRTKFPTFSGKSVTTVFPLKFE